MSILLLERLPLLAVVYATSIYAVMLWISSGLLKLNKVEQSATSASSRFGCIDGLRGILACGVFIHHSFVAYAYFVTGRWEWSASPILNELGQTTVAAFFMITGFLFTIKAGSTHLEWKSFLISRLARLAPLYFVVVLVLVLTLAILSAGSITEPLWKISEELFLWLTFAIGGRPDINGYPMTWTLIAGVNWTLKFEIFFYVVVVPGIYLLLRLVSTKTAFYIACIALALLLGYRSFTNQEGGLSLYAAHFLGGVLIAFAYQIPRAKAVMQAGPYWCCAAFALLFIAGSLHSHGSLVVIATIILLSSVVGGFSFFGLLKTRSALWLGDISYGIYLIHGFVIWIILFGARREQLLESLSLPLYWALILIASSLIALLASVSYVCLEKPCIGWARKMDRRRSEAGVSPAIS